MSRIRPEMNEVEILEAYTNFEPSRDYLSAEQQIKIDKLSPGEQTGILSMYRYIYIRKIINENLESSEQKHEFELHLREQLSLIDTSNIEGIREHQDLRLLHHCSVTADQAMLADVAFI